MTKLAKIESQLKREREESFHVIQRQSKRIISLEYKNIELKVAAQKICDLFMNIEDKPNAYDKGLSQLFKYIMELKRVLNEEEDS